MYIYKIWFKGYAKSDFDEVHSMNYKIENGFITFYNSMPGNVDINICSIPSDDVLKILFCEKEVKNDKNKIRENKLKRILKKKSFWKFWKK